MLKHDNILKGNLKPVKIEGGYDYYLIQKLFDTSLKKLIYDERKVFDINELLNIIIQVLSALTEAAKHKIVHRNIKPGNILISEDFKVVVSDWGESRILDSSNLTNCRGSNETAAPEIYNSVDKN